MSMTTPTAVETIRNFYAALESGDAARALGLMSDDIEWITMWHYKVDGRGPQKVAEGILMPMMKEWKSFKLIPTEYIAYGRIAGSLCRDPRHHRPGGRRQIRPCVDRRRWSNHALPPVYRHARRRRGEEIARKKMSNPGEVTRSGLISTPDRHRAAVVSALSAAMNLSPRYRRD